ncbi:MAG: lipocalin-like domain-containing protein [Pseudomonadota bacterium]
MTNFIADTTWLLKFYRSDNLDGSKDYPMGKRPHGILIYGSSGYMSVQMARAGRKDRRLLPFTSTDTLDVSPEDAKRAMDTYLAYCGTYSIDLEANVVTHSIQSCSYPAWIKRKQKRSFERDGDTLILTTLKPALFRGKLRTARLEWERVR